MRVSPAGLAGWGLAGGMVAASVRGWSPEGPEQVLWLGLAMASAWRLGRAACRVAAEAIRSRLLQAVPAPPVWPRPYQPRPGEPTRRRRSRRPGRLRLAVLVLALAGLVGAWITAWRAARQVALLAEFEKGRVAWVGGFVAALPRQTPFSVRLTLYPAYLSPAASALPPQGPWTELPGGVQVEWAAQNTVLPPPEPGEWVAVRGLVQLPEEAAYPGAFSPRRYLNARGVVLTVRARSPGRAVVGAPARPAPVGVRVRATALRAGAGIADRIRERMGPTGSRWLLAVGMGQKEALPASQQEALQAAGLGHLLSVSGVHVGLVAGPLLALARRVGRLRPLGRLAAAAAAVSAGWMYAAMTGMSAPAVRASMVQSAALGLWAAGRRAGLVDVLGVAAAAQLLWGSPWLGSDPGFQMSYAATLGIGLFLAASEERIRQGAPGRRPGWLLAALGRGGRRLLGAAGISISAWAAVSPLVMAYFGRASTVGALVSVPAAPLCGVLLWSGLVAAAAPKPVGELAGWLSDLSALALERLTVAGQSLEVRMGVQMPLWAWTLPAGAVVVASLGLREQSARRRRRWAAWATALLGAAALFQAPPAAPHAGALVSAPAGRGWIAAGLGPGRATWLVVKLHAEQDVVPALYRTAAILAGLGWSRADLAVMSGEVRRDGDDAGAVPVPLAKFARVWAVEDGGVLLLPSGDPGRGRRAAEVRFRGLRLVGPSGSDGFRLEMGSADFVEFDLTAACLRQGRAGRQICRRDGEVYLTGE